MTRTKPSGDDLAKAIATIRSHSAHVLSKKDLLGSLQKQHPTWKLTERRVSKYDKKLSKYQAQGSQVSVAGSDNGDEGSIGSNASNASVVARRLMMLGSSIRKSLSLRGGDHNCQEGASVEVLSQTIDFVQEVDLSTPKKGTNLLPQLEDDSKSFTDDEGCFKVHVNHASSPTEETMSPKSGESLDDYSEENSIAVEKGLPIDNIEVLNSGKALGEGKNVNVPESLGPVTVKSLTFGKQQDILLAEKGKRESLVCEGCVVL